MVGRKKGKTSLIAKALQAEKEAVVFFGFAYKVTHDPRVREVLNHLAGQNRKHVENLEGIIAELGISMPRSEDTSEFYPISELRRTECYVCGFSAESDSIPESCPRCGASGRAFEKEIGLGKAWELAERGVVAVLKMLGEAERHADSRSKSILSGQIRLEQRLLAEARKHIEKPKR